MLFGLSILFDLTSSFSTLSYTLSTNSNQTCCRLNAPLITITYASFRSLQKEYTPDTHLSKKEKKTGHLNGDQSVILTNSLNSDMNSLDRMNKKLMDSKRDSTIR